MVLFDDILVYNSSMVEHLQHLEAAFQVLANEQLFAKLSKCFFLQHQIEYLGHISEQGVCIGPVKIEV